MTKPRERQGFRWGAAVLARMLVGAVLVLPTACGATPGRDRVLARSPPDIPANEDCYAGPRDAAAQNAQGLDTLAIAPFHRPESGWAVYEPLVRREASTDCAAATPGFAVALGHWQRAHGLPPSGVLDAAALDRVILDWELRRAFVIASAHGCPPSADERTLAVVSARNSYGGKTLSLTPPALAAYNAMAAAARAEVPAIAHDPRLLTIFSAYRSPDADAARCAAENNCQGVVRTTCSAHRTGTAIDVFLGSAPGYRPDNSADANRLYISRGPAYRWMVRHAGRFGFEPYPFEPWHWEWNG